MSCFLSLEIENFSTLLDYYAASIVIDLYSESASLLRTVFGKEGGFCASVCLLLYVNFCIVSSTLAPLLFVARLSIVLGMFLLEGAIFMPCISDCLRLNLSEGAPNHPIRVTILELY